MDFSAMPPEDQPDALKSNTERQRRLMMLNQEHMRPLTQYVADFRALHPTYQVPDFDPCDGGVEAKVLFLLRTPGSKAMETGFVSRNNPDATARFLCEFMQEAGINRRATLIWNVVPWYIGDEASMSAILQFTWWQALPHLQTLLRLLPFLSRVVLCGGDAQKARMNVAHATPASILDMPICNTQVLNALPHKREEAQATLRQVADFLNTNNSETA